MGQRTILDEATAATLLKGWGRSLERLTALPEKGTVNSCFVVEAGGERFFLRVNEGKKESDVAAEAALLTRLVEAGVPTPAPLFAEDGRAYGMHGDKCVSLFRWVDGREAEGLARDVAAPLVGEALGVLHRAARTMQDVELPPDHYALDELERRLRGFAGDERFAGVARMLEDELARGRMRRAAGGARGLVHQDLFPDNVLVDGMGRLVAMLDFEQATRGVLAYDVAVCVISWCWDGGAIDAAAEAMLVGAYEKVAGPVDRTELAEECRLAAARFTITRVTDVFLAAGVAEDLRRRKDYRDYSRRLVWLRGRS